ncbi:MAG TPA: hypothetical protein VGC30_04405, partial [Dokdonella sp.]
MSAVRSLLRVALLCAPLAAVHGLAAAHRGEPPYGLLHRARVGAEPATAELRAIDAAARRAELEPAARDAIGPRTKRLQVADDEAVSIAPERDGAWQTLDDGSRLWRLRVRAAGATDLRLGFARFAPPPGTTLHVIGADDAYQGPYTAADAAAGRLATAAVPGDSAIVELHVPAGAALADGAVVLSDVGAGFRDRFGRAAQADT